MKAYTKAAGGVLTESSIQTDSDLNKTITVESFEEEKSEEIHKEQNSACQASEQQNEKINVPISFFKIMNLDDDRHIKLSANVSPEKITQAL